MTDYQCHDAAEWCLPSLSWENVAPELDELTNITSLQICASGWPDMFGRPSWVYARTPALRNLDLELATCDLEGEGCCANGWNLLDRIFGPRSTSRQAPTLKSLRITRMCLMLAGDALPQLMNLKELEHLQLIQCTDIDPFLQNLESLRLEFSSVCIDEFYRQYTLFRCERVYALTGTAQAHHLEVGGYMFL